MKTVLDAETTFQIMPDGGYNPSPYHPDNYLVSVGFDYTETIKGHKQWCSEVEYICFKHNTEKATPAGHEMLQAVLASTTLLIGHNIKFDIQWLWAAGFKYDRPVYDTMIHEYIEAGGQYRKLDLNSCCIRHGIEGKLDATKEYLKKGIGFEAMPWDSVVKPYGIQDVTSTKKLYLAQTDE